MFPNIKLRCSAALTFYSDSPFCPLALDPWMSPCKPQTCRAQPSSTPPARSWALHPAVLGGGQGCSLQAEKSQRPEPVWWDPSHSGNSHLPSCEQRCQQCLGRELWEVAARFGKIKATEAHACRTVHMSGWMCLCYCFSLVAQYTHLFTLA